VSEGDPFESTRMTLGEHLDELRSRLFRGAVALAVAFSVCWAFYERVADVVQRPFDRAAVMINDHERARVEEHLAAHADVPRGKYFEVVGGTEQLIHRVDAPQLTSAGEGFLFALKTSFYFALFLGGPVLLWQLWKFIAAGLHEHEKRAALRYFPYSVAFFVGGVVFGYFLLVPYGLFFLGTAFPLERFQPIFTLSSYLSFLNSLTLALGAVFQLPVLMVFFARLGLVEPPTYARYRGHFIVGAFVLAAVITPPDPVTQIMVAAPMVVLFEIGLIGARLFARERRPDVASVVES
jgi:Tat protein translocase TatC